MSEVGAEWAIGLIVIKRSGAKTWDKAVPDIAMFVVLLGEFDCLEGVTIILGAIQQDREALRRMAIDMEVAPVGGASSAEGWSVRGGTGLCWIDEHRRVVFCLWLAGSLTGEWSA